MDNVITNMLLLAELPGLCEIKSKCRNLTTFTKVMHLNILPIV